MLYDTDGTSFLKGYVLCNFGGCTPAIVLYAGSGGISSAGKSWICLSFGIGDSAADHAFALPDNIAKASGNGNGCFVCNILGSFPGGNGLQSGSTHVLLGSTFCTAMLS